MNILIFGDSITYGEWDTQGGWANRIRAQFDQQALPQPDQYTLVYNLGIPSDTSAGMLERLKAETRARLIRPQEECSCTFIIAIGTNDSRWLVEEQRRDLDLDKFQNNLKKITSAAREFSEQIYYVGLLPCNEPELLQTANRHQWIETFDNQALLDYNLAIAQHCQQNRLEFIDVFNAFINTDYPTLLADGLHPNNDGHALIYEQVIEKLSGIVSG